MQSPWRRCVLLVRSGDPLGTLPPRIAPKSRCIWGAGTASCILQERVGDVTPILLPVSPSSSTHLLPISALGSTSCVLREGDLAEHLTILPPPRRASSSRMH